MGSTVAARRERQLRAGIETRGIHPCPIGNVATTYDEMIDATAGNLST